MSTMIVSSTSGRKENAQEDEELLASGARHTGQGMLPFGSRTAS